MQLFVFRKVSRKVLFLFTTFLTLLFFFFEVKCSRLGLHSFFSSFTEFFFVTSQEGKKKKEKKRKVKQKKKMFLSVFSFSIVKASFEETATFLSNILQNSSSVQLKVNIPTQGKKRWDQSVVALFIICLCCLFLML